MTVQSEPSDVTSSSRSAALRKRPLTADRIVQAALELLDRDGLQGISIRRLGKHLGTGATTLYWHVPDKDTLLDLTVDRLMQEAVEATSHRPNTTWRNELTAYAAALRTVLMRHKDAAALVVARPPSGPQGLRFKEAVLQALADAGFGGHERTLAYSALTGYTIGEVAFGDGADQEAFQYGLERLLDGFEAALRKINRADLLR